MKVHEVMTKEISCCGPGTNAAAAGELIRTRNCGALMVIEGEGRLVGIVTERDLFIVLGTNDRNRADLPVRALMQNQIPTCSPEDDIRTALEAMAQHRVQRLPVVDSAGALKGVLSLDNIMLCAGADGVSIDDVLNAIKTIWGREVDPKTGAQTPAPLRSKLSDFRDANA